MPIKVRFFKDSYNRFMYEIQNIALVLPNKVNNRVQLLLAVTTQIQVKCQLPLNNSKIVP